MLNNAPIDIGLLSVFDSVYRHRNVSRAAAELGLVQPTVSNRLRRLRSLLGDPLFVKAPDGVMPTPFSDSIARYVSEALGLLQQGLRDHHEFDAHTAERTFSIIMTDIGEAVFLPPLLDICARVAPGLKFRTAQMSTDHTIRALRSGEVDLAVGYIPELITGIFRLHLNRTEYVCIAARDNPLADGGITRSDFFSARHAIAEAQGTGHSIVEQTLKKSRITDRIGIRVPHFLALPLIVASSDMVATIPRPLGVIFQNVAPIRIHKHPLKLPAIDINIFWHERFNHDGANVWLRGVFRQIRDAIAWA